MPLERDDLHHLGDQPFRTWLQAMGRCHLFFGRGWLILVAKYLLFPLETNQPFISDTRRTWARQMILQKFVDNRLARCRHPSSIWVSVPVQKLDTEKYLALSLQEVLWFLVWFRLPLSIGTAGHRSCVTKSRSICKVRGRYPFFSFNICFCKLPNSNGRI